MSGSRATETIDDLKARVVRSIAEEVGAMSWISDADKSDLTDVMTEILPLWHAWIHRRRQRGWLTGADQVPAVRAVGVTVLSNMLSALARNTTVALPSGEDRELTIWRVTKHLHRLVLDNLKP